MSLWGVEKSIQIVPWDVPGAFRRLRPLCGALVFGPGGTQGRAQLSKKSDKPIIDDLNTPWGRWPGEFFDEIFPASYTRVFAETELPRSYRDTS